MSPIRRASLMLTVLVGLGLGMARGGATPEETRSERAGVVREVSSTTALRLGVEAMQAGRQREADLWLRAAWKARESRRQASDRLWTLHDDPDVVLAVDEDEVGGALRELGNGFLRHETAHFIVLSDAEIEWVRSRAALMERTRHEFYRVAGRMGIPVVPHERKLLCILIDSYEQYADFAFEQDGLDAPWIAGYYSLPHNRVVFYNDLNGPAFAPALGRLRERDGADVRHAGEALAAAEERDRRSRSLANVERQALEFSAAKTAHETVHLLSFNSGMQDATRTYPIWLSEGLASCFEGGDGAGAFGPEKAAPQREAALESLIESGKLMPLERLITLAAVPNDEPDAIEQVYSQGHGLFRLLYRTRREGLAEYIQALGDATRPPTTSEQLDLFERCFGDVRDVEARLATSTRGRP